MHGHTHLNTDPQCLVQVLSSTRTLIQKPREMTQQASFSAGDVLATATSAMVAESLRGEENLDKIMDACSRLVSDLMRVNVCLHLDLTSVSWRG